MILSSTDNNRARISAHIATGGILGLLAYIKMTAALSVLAGLGILSAVEWIYHKHYGYLITFISAGIVCALFNLLLDIHTAHFTLRPALTFFKQLRNFERINLSWLGELGAMTIGLMIFLVLTYHLRLVFTTGIMSSRLRNNLPELRNTAIFSLSMFGTAFVMTNIFYIKSMELSPSDISSAINIREHDWSQLLYPGGIGIAVCGSLGMAKWIEGRKILRSIVLLFGIFFIYQSILYSTKQFRNVILPMIIPSQKQTKLIVDALRYIPIKNSLILTNASYPNLSATFGHHFFFLHSPSINYAQNPDEFAYRYRHKRDFILSNDRDDASEIIADSDITHILIIKYWWKGIKKIVMLNNFGKIQKPRGWRLLYENQRCIVYSRNNLF